MIKYQENNIEYYYDKAFGWIIEIKNSAKAVLDRIYFGGKKKDINKVLDFIKNNY